MVFMWASHWINYFVGDYSHFNKVRLLNTDNFLCQSVFTTAITTVATGSMQQ